MKVPKPIKLDSGNWFIRMRLGGESIPITMPTKAECIREAQLIKAEHIAGKRKPKAKAEDMTIGQLLDDYIDSLAHTASPSTLKGYKTIRDVRFKKYEDLSYNAVQSWQSIIDGWTAELAPKTVKNSWTCFCSALKRKKLAIPDVRLPAIPRQTKEFLAFDEIPIFLNEIQGDKAELGALILLHSFRLSEACAMTWENHVDLKKKMLQAKGAYVQGTGGYYLNEVNKNQYSQRWVPIMMDRLTELLEAEPDKTGKVIRMAPETLQRRIDRVCDKAGLPKVGAHGLRHSFASLASHLGLPELETAKLGGWADYTTMRKIYTHIAEKDSLRHINAMTEFYKKANENANET